MLRQDFLKKFLAIASQKTKINYFCPVSRKCDRTSLTNYLLLLLRTLIVCCLQNNATQFTQSLLRIYIFAKLIGYFSRFCMSNFSFFTP